MDNSLFDAEDDDKENVRSGGHVTNASDVARSPLKPTAVHQTQVHPRIYLKGSPPVGLLVRRLLVFFYQ